MSRNCVVFSPNRKFPMDRAEETSHTERRPTPARLVEGLLFLVVGLGLGVGAGDDVAPLQPAMEVDIGAALRAERIIRLAARLAADWAGPAALARTRLRRGLIVAAH